MCAAYPGSRLALHSFQPCCAPRFRSRFIHSVRFRTRLDITSSSAQCVGRGLALRSFQPCCAPRFAPASSTLCAFALDSTSPRQVLNVSVAGWLFTLSSRAAHLDSLPLHLGRGLALHSFQPCCAPRFAPASSRSRAGALYLSRKA